MNLKHLTRKRGLEGANDQGTGGVINSAPHTKTLPLLEHSCNNPGLSGSSKTLPGSESSQHYQKLADHSW